MDPSELPDTPYERALMLQGMLVSLATGGKFDENIYLELRSYFMGSKEMRNLLPDFVRASRANRALWGHFKRISSSYQGRSEHIYDSFKPLFDFIENKYQAPADTNISEILQSFDPEGVHLLWDKALDRRHSDPEGAITLARTILESVCKRILDEYEEEYKDAEDLPKLYHMVAEKMNLAPSQHTEVVFKSILGSCQNIVNSLGTLRNKISDAHAQGKKPIRPSARHAAFAVNIAGAMATYLVETYFFNKTKQ